MPPSLEPVLAPRTLLGSFLVLYFGAVLFVLFTSGTSFLYYRVLRRDRYFLADSDNLTQERAQRPREILWNFYNILGNSLVTAPIHHLVVTGQSRLYFRVSEYGWGYAILSVLLVLLITEPAVYWAHRLLHLPFLYRHLHLHHHQFRVPSPWTSLAFHPLDSFLQAAPLYFCAFLFPIHVGVFLFFLLFLQVWSTLIHERVTWVRWGLINYTAHHTLHHRANKHNYGQFFTVCDRLWGTYKAPWGLVYDGSEASQTGNPPLRVARN